MTVIASNVNEPLPEPVVRGLRGTTHVDEVNIDCEAFFNDKGKWGEHYREKVSMRCCEWRKTPCEVNREDLVSLLSLSCSVCDNLATLDRLT